MTTTENDLVIWLRDWVSGITGLDVSEVDPHKPLESFGLSSRDAVIMSGELENKLGTRIDPTIAYQYPTIAALAAVLTAPEAPVRQVRRREVNSSPGSHDIAIIGSAGRFPGADSVDEFWELLISARSATGPLPESRWSEYSSDPVVRASMDEQNTDGGYLRDIATFDSEFFGLSPVEATNMDPQQRIMLELAWEALENAHVPANQLRGESVGVFVGSSNNDYGMLMSADSAQAHPYALTGSSSAVIPNRISYAFDFRGPSVNVDTACSSSLVSTHYAVRALRGGECDLALAGGVNVLANPLASLMFAEMGVISPTSKIHAFSDDADGLVRSEAAGLLVLKRVDDALQDGDTILGVIKGTAINSDGHSNGLTAPNPQAQKDVLRRAYADAGIDPSEVDLVEAHGTGTILGDPIEATALGAVLGRERSASNPLLLGSSKSNIGHSESAAGAVGLIKVVEALRHDAIPPSINYSSPNHFVDFDAERIEVVEDPREWPRYSGRRIAGVSGFGFGGTNAHVVIADFDPAEYDTTAVAPNAELADLSGVALPVSGHLPSRRKEAATVLADFLEGRKESDLVPVARSLARRNHGRSSAVVQARTIEEAVSRLRQVAQGKNAPGIATADSPEGGGPVFVYSGFGSQHRKMAKRLVELSPLFRRRMEQLDDVVRFESGWSMLEIITDDEQTYDIQTGQVTITAIQIAQTDLLASFGITPGATMGMSMGEIGAAYGAGGISGEEAVRIACHRARLMSEGEALLAGTDGEGAMAVVELGREEVAAFVAAHPEASGVEPAVYAGPGMTTVGGPSVAVDFLVATLEAENNFARKLQVKGAGHTSMLDPIMGDLAGELAGMDGQPLRVPLFSSVDRGVVYPAGVRVHNDEYFLRMTRQPVYFQDAVEAAFAAGHSTLVEITPHPVAVMGMMNTAFSVDKPGAHLLYTTKRKVDEVESLRDLVARLYVQGVEVDFTGFYGPGEVIDAPGAPFRRQHLWTSARPHSGSSSLLGERVKLPDGKIAYSIQADQVLSPRQLIESVATEVNPEAVVVATKEHGVLPTHAELTTIVSISLGGLSMNVYNGNELLIEGFATTLDVPQPPALHDVVSVGASAPRGDSDIEVIRWDPNSGETVTQRLRAIVSESMGYDVDDLPDELPLIDLGLDSLMGMRIKNRVENDFRIPPLQVQTLRDASVADVIKIVESAVAGIADEPQQMAYNSANRDPGSEVAKAKTAGVGVAPRDASERMVFGAWAKYSGAAAAGVTSELAEISDAVAAEIAAHLTQRSGIVVTAADVRGADTLEPLANKVREGLETPVEGNVRVFREREKDTVKPSVFLFHPAGGSSSVYDPLSRRLSGDVPVYGMERLEGPLEERARAYIDDIVRLSGGAPIVLAGWSFGGALAYEVAHQLGEDKVAFIALLDTTRPSKPSPNTPEETKKRWERYASFAHDTYGLDFPVPYDLLDTAGEDVVLSMLGDFLTTTDASEHGLAAGVLEHQRASFVDTQMLSSLDFTRWAGLNVPVLLFRSERMHEGALVLEPAYADIDEDGGWGAIIDDLEIVHLPGDHLAVVDEPAVGIVGKHMNDWIDNVNRR